jgi:hypothetical protein
VGYSNSGFTVYSNMNKPIKGEDPIGDCEEEEAEIPAA